MKRCRAVGNALTQRYHIAFFRQDLSTPDLAQRLPKESNDTPQGHTVIVVSSLSALVRQCPFISMSARKQMNIPRSLAWLVTPGGLILVVLCAHSLWLGLASERWPRVDALVTKSKVYSADRATDEIRLKYEYRCGEKVCVGERWRYKLRASSPDTLWKITRRCTQKGRSRVSPWANLPKSQCHRATLSSLSPNPAHPSTI